MLVIGHRGAGGHAAENTMSSIELAINMGSDFVEIDVQRTKDGKLVIFHDRTMKRLTGLSGYVWDYSFRELQKSARVFGKHRIPRLEEVCELFVRSRANLYVEIKYPGIEPDVLSVLRTYLDVSQYAIGSFYHRCILETKQLDATVKTVALLAGVPVSTKRIIRDSKCDYLGLGIGSLDEQQVHETHSVNCGVIVWTVDETDEVPLLIKLGVDGIVTNFPDKIIAYLGEQTGA